MNLPDLIQYIIDHTDRGECKCGRCFDRGETPDPSGHGADMIFFKVVAKGSPTAERFRELTNAFEGAYPAKPLDGKEYNYQQLGAWIGDQGLAMQFMALGALLGVFTLLTPYTVLGADLPAETASAMAGAGYLSIKAVV